MWVRSGKHGSYQTASEMARLVREAAVKDQGLEKFAAQILINSKLDSHSDPEQSVDAIFRYVQGLTYISDSTGQGNFDAVASARDTIEKGFGDCDDLSVLLASLLALVGFRPSFVLARMNESSEGFDHVYVQVETKKGRIALDPSTRKFGIGWESPRALEKVSYSIFGKNGSAGASGFADAGPLIVTGATIGASLIPVVGPFLARLIGPLSKLFHHGPTAQQRQLGSNFDQADKACAAFLLTLNHKADSGTLTGSDMAEAVSQVSQVAQLAIAEMPQDASGYVKRQWQGSGSDIGEEKRYGQWLTALAAKVVPGSEGTILPGSVNNSAGSGAGGIGATGSASPLTLSSANAALPVALLLGLGFLFLMRR